MSQIIVSICFSSFRIILLKTYLGIFLIEIKGRQRAAGWLLFFFAQMYITMNVTAGTWGIFLLGSFVSMELVGFLAYTDPVWKRFTFTFLFAVLWGLCEVFFLLGFQLLIGVDHNGIRTIFILSDLVMVPFVWGIRNYMKKKEIGNQLCIEVISLILPLMTAMTVYIAFFMTVEQTTQQADRVLGWLMLGTVAMILLNLCIYPTYLQRIEEAQVKMNERYYVRQLDLLQEQKHLEEEEVVELHTKRHDLKQKLIYIHELARYEETDKLMEILSQMIGETGKKGRREGTTGNLVIDALVNHLCKEANDRKINLKTSINLPLDLNIKETDLCILQGNAFDNAVEALESVGESERDMWVEMKYEKGCFLLNVKNRFQGDYRKEDEGELKSSKRDGIHGLGIRSMKKVANKYHGSLNAVGENGIFTLRAVLYEQK
ncbi:ATP-binding protein [Clostridium sp. E02]|uniref:ATP-binding protein n=1 Tax=Clostridium sp. E02 TaxID=2487134 RepID=UPI0013DE12B4|nr:ATP-binding protein [Clostridium sp. E02]